MKKEKKMKEEKKDEGEEDKMEDQVKRLLLTILFLLQSLEYNITGYLF